MKVDKSKWKKKTLGDICSFKRGLTYPKNEECQTETNNAVLRSNNIDIDTHSLIFDELKYLNESYEIPTDKKLKNKSILICMSNGSMKHIGKVAFIDKDYNLAFGGFMGLIIPEKINAKFLYYKLRSSSFKSSISNITNGINITNLKFSSISHISLYYPESFDEQQAIASELDAIQKIIEDYKAQLADLDVLAQSIFFDMFGDPITNPKGWKLSNILSFVDEITSSKRIFANEYVKEGVPFYRIKEIIEKANQRPISVELFITENRYSEIKSSFGVPQINDLLITAVGSIGEIWIVDNDMPFYFKDGNVIWLKTSKDAVPIYLKEVLFHIIAYIKDKMNGAAYSALTIVKLKAINIPNPPLCFQQQFAKQIEAIEKQKDLLREQLKDAETLMAERMQYYFS